MKKNNVIKNKSGMSSEAKKTIIIIVVVVLVLAFMYFLTTRILEKNSSSSDDTVTESVIGYDKILAGESFDQSEEEYYVIYYDSTNAYSSIGSLVSYYQMNNTGTRLYSVDLSDGLNKKYVTDGDIVTTDAPSLRVKDNTLLKFNNGDVVETITDITEITNILNS